VVEVLYKPRVWEEIHKVSEEMSKEWGKMSSKEWTDYWEKRKKKLETEGYEEIVTSDGHRILRKKK